MATPPKTTNAEWMQPMWGWVEFAYRPFRCVCSLALFLTATKSQTRYATYLLAALQPIGRQTGPGLVPFSSLAFLEHSGLMARVRSRWLERLPASMLLPDLLEFLIQATIMTPSTHSVGRKSSRREQAEEMIGMASPQSDLLRR
ncbi:hypothetical protein P170DRAFT_123805 [Aspergillus steynii IBT 23096]|uniref:Uncharacterized protein n=1 Tax=Aspergillus steynii IBT 23096 TaxID=1392250 RepID=A0A2I2GJU7_9EURO|nr:uncharacterized protein P170DRAFT_123805 [Aspergillus steynii IBT 23096]PLB53127.1 hypothetical protein P170DRAFT_123805 [Aspergillus steynii IBT 23096]